MLLSYCLIFLGERVHEDGSSPSPYIVTNTCGLRQQLQQYLLLHIVYYYNVCGYMVYVCIRIVCVCIFVYIYLCVCLSGTCENLCRPTVTIRVCIGSLVEIHIATRLRRVSSNRSRKQNISDFIILYALVVNCINRRRDTVVTALKKKIPIYIIICNIKGKKKYTYVCMFVRMQRLYIIYIRIQNGC